MAYEIYQKREDDPTGLSITICENKTGAGVWITITDFKPENPKYAKDSVTELANVVMAKLNTDEITDNDRFFNTDTVVGLMVGTCITAIVTCLIYSFTL